MSEVVIQDAIQIPQNRRSIAISMQNDLHKMILTDLVISSGHHIDSAGGSNLFYLIDHRLASNLSDKVLSTQCIIIKPAGARLQSNISPAGVLSWPVKVKQLQELLVRLPIQNSMVQNTEQTKILLAYDNRIDQRMTERMLELLGYSCDLASNSDQVIEMASKEDYNLVLLDLTISSTEVKTAQLIREARPNQAPKIISLINPDESNGQTACCDETIKKPISKKKLAQLFASLRRRT